MNAMKDRLVAELNGERLDRYGREIDVPEVEGGRGLTWPEIERLTGGATGTINTPCPYCGPWKLNSTHFRIERPTLGFCEWQCFYCGVRGELRDKNRADPEAEARARALGEERKRERAAQNAGIALRIWDEAIPLPGTSAEKYLHARAIHDLPPNVDDVLRFHPRCRFGLSIAPCMIALLRDVHTNARTAIHRTWVRSNGEALGRMTLGPVARSAVKLWPLAGDRLAVGEGIETVLAAATHEVWREPLRPAWSATMARNLALFPVIEAVRELRILADNDANGVGQKNAETCRARWLRAGKNAIRLMPPRPPNMKKVDFNDLVRGAAQ